MHTQTALIREFPDWLVEMDIVRSPTVEELLRHAINERPPSTPEQLGSDDEDEEVGQLVPVPGTSVIGDHREKKAPFNAQQHSYLYWPDARVPYAFHPYIGMYTYVHMCLHSGPTRFRHHDKQGTVFYWYSI